MVGTAKHDKSLADPGRVLRNCGQRHHLWFTNLKYFVIYDDVILSSFHVFSGGSRISHKGGANLLFGNFLPKAALTLKTFGLGSVPRDPPLVFSHSLNPETTR